MAPAKTVLAFTLLCVAHALRRKSTKVSHAVADEQEFNAKLYAVNQQNPGFPGAHANVNVGLAIGGGGHRALGWSMGVLRALEHLGLMGKFDAISGVSGGTWVGALYMFQSKYSLKQLFGPMTNPGALTLGQLEKASARLNDVTSEPTTAKLAWLKIAYPDHQVWERLMTDIVMEPFDLGVREDMYMAGSDAHRSDIIRRNPQLTKSQFHVPVPGRPKVLIMGAIITAPTNYKADFYNSVPFQMSPDFSGSNVWPNFTGKVNPMHYTSSNPLRSDIDAIVGGGFIESFAHGSREPRDQSRSGVIRVQKAEGYSMSLTTAVSISSAPIFRPRRYMWPVTPKGTKQEAIEFEYADGGICENTGLHALLQRKARKVVQIISSDRALDLSIDFCKDRSEKEWKQIHETCDKSSCAVSSMFGYKYSDFLNEYGRNKIFPTERGHDLFCRIQNLKKAGKPAVFTETLPVLANEWYGIEGGFDVQVLFVVLEVSTKFEKSLPSSMQEELKSNSMFENYPHYGLIENTDVIYLKRPMTNLLAAQGEYFVMQNQGLFHNFLR